MKRFFIIMVTVALLLCAFSAANAASKVKLSIEKRYYIAPEETTLEIVISSSVNVESALAFSYSIDGEVYEGVMEAGTNKAVIAYLTPQVEKSVKKELVLLGGDDYVRGTYQAEIRVIPEPSFEMFNGGVVVAPAGGSGSVEYEILDKRVLSSGLKMELRDDEGNLLAYNTFTKDYYHARIRFEVPESWSGTKTVALWFGGKKLSDDYLVLVRKDEPAIKSIATDSKKIVITVDCGAGSLNSLRKWLDLMDEYNVKATFFLTGRFAKDFPTAASEIIARGHDVGNHSVVHKDMSGWKYDQVSAEVEAVNQLISEQTNGYVPQYFRAPYGAWSYSMITMLDYLDLATIQWTASSGDSGTYVTEKSVFENVTGENLKPGSIYLFHNASPCFGVMDDVFQYYQENGYEMVSMSMLMPEEYTVDSKGVVRPAE